MSLLRFIPGIIALQVATGALVYSVLNSGTSLEALWIPLGIIVVILTFLAAFWFGSIADHLSKDAVTGAVVQQSRERQQLMVAAEIDKRAALEESHQRILRETARAQAQANWRLGLGLSGLLVLGGIMLAIEFMTVGLLIMAMTGGALGGYLMRARQDTRLVRHQGGTVPLLKGQIIESAKKDTDTRQS